MGGKAIRVVVYLNTAEKRKVDDVRGDVSLTDWVRRVVADAIGTDKRRRRELTEEPWPMLPEPLPPPPGGDLRNVRKGKFAVGQRFDLDAALRAVSIMRLYSEGKNFTEIAATLGYRSADAARAAYRVACDKYISYQAQEYGKVILSEHVNDIGKIDAVIEKPGYIHDVKGALVNGPDGEFLEDENVRLQALDLRRKTLESIRRMTGVDAPKKTELDIQMGQELADRIKATLGKFEALAAGMSVSPDQLPDDDIVEGYVLGDTDVEVEVADVQVGVNAAAVEGVDDQPGDENHDDRDDHVEGEADN